MTFCLFQNQQTYIERGPIFLLHESRKTVSKIARSNINTMTVTRVWAPSPTQRGMKIIIISRRDTFPNGQARRGLLFSIISLFLLSSFTSTHLCFCELLDVQPIIMHNHCSSKHFVLHHLLSNNTWADLTAWDNLVVKQTTVAYWLSIWHTCFLASIKISNGIFFYVLVL